MGRKNRRSKIEYRDRLGFNPRKYIQPAHSDGRLQTENRNYGRGYGRGYECESRPYRTPYRGEVWFAELGTHPGTSVQDGCRPVFIISNDRGNHHANTIVVLPMTTHLKKYELPSHIVLRQEHLEKIDPGRPLSESMILAEQITTISKSALRSYLGKVEAADKLTEIDNAVMLQLGMIADQE